GRVGARGLSWEPIEFDRGAAQFDLTVAIDPSISRRIDIEYATDLYSRARVERLADAYVEVLEAVLRDPGAKVSELPLIDAATEARVITEWNRTDAPMPEATVAEQIVTQ